MGNQTSSSSKNSIIIISVAVIVLAILLYFLFFNKKESPQSAENAPTIRIDSQTPDLGDRISDSVSSEAITNKIPEVDTTPNPIKGVYKNPFE